MHQQGSCVTLLYALLVTNLVAVQAPKTAQTPAGQSSRYTPLPIRVATALVPVRGHQTHARFLARVAFRPQFAVEYLHKDARPGRHPVSPSRAPAALVALLPGPTPTTAPANAQLRSQAPRRRCHAKSRDGLLRAALTSLLPLKGGRQAHDARRRALCTHDARPQPWRCGGGGAPLTGRVGAGTRPHRRGRSAQGRSGCRPCSGRRRRRAGAVGGAWTAVGCDALPLAGLPTYSLGLDEGPHAHGQAICARRQQLMSLPLYHHTPHSGTPGCAHLGHQVR